MTTKQFNYSTCTVRVHIPDLTKEERDKRYREISRSAEKLMKEVIKNER